MDDTIQRILDTEEDIRDKISKKKDRLDHIQDEISAAKKDIDKKLNDEYESSVAETREKAAARLESEMSRIDKKYEKIEANLLEELESGQKDLSDKLFAKVIE